MSLTRRMASSKRHSAVKLATTTDFLCKVEKERIVSDLQLAKAPGRGRGGSGSGSRGGGKIEVG